jgi:uncharacterized membrane protein YkvA (DUF1232 family)
MAHERTRSPLRGAERLAEPGTIDQARLTWRLMRDPRVSWIKLAIPLFAALYLISPIDPIPDVLLGIGQIDDLGVAIALAIATMRLLPRLAPAHVVAEHRADLFGNAAAPRADGPAGPVYDGVFRVRDDRAAGYGEGAGR